ncbi:MAG TPA: aldo/keto reductase [Phycisphaerae bacterium]|nr:aldo/keto reductase [Phycisphaerae bacterium]
MSHEPTRRQFLQTTAALAGAAALTPLLASAQTAPSAPTTTPAKPTATDLVPLGNTGLKISRVGIGTGSENGRTLTALGKDAFIALLHHAFDRGITHFDSCDRYTTVDWMPDALKGLPREKIFLQSKITGIPSDPLAAIDKERKRLNTDYLDSCLVHSQTVANWTTMDTWKRVMDGFNQAKDKKWILSKGASCHNLPALTDAVTSDFHEVHLVRVNPQGKYIDGPRGNGYTAAETFPVDPVLEQLKLIKKQNRGVIAMKIFGNGLFTAPEDREKSIRFALSLKEVDALLMGFKSKAEIDEALDRVNRALADAA